MGSSYRDHLEGVAINENAERYKSALKSGDLTRKIVCS